MNTDKKTIKKFNSDEIAMFCDQIAMLLNSGIPVYEGTYMLYSEMEDSRTKGVLGQIDEAVKSNSSLYQALVDTGSFPEYMTHMVQVGEATGRLEDVMRSLASYYERESRVSAGIKSAVAYPMILFTVMAGIMVVLAWKILPMFEQMFLELNSEVAESTTNVMQFGLTAGRIAAIVVCAVLAALFLLLAWYKTKSGQNALKSFFSGFRFTKKLSELLATGKFISSMALMISSGVELGESLEREAEACENRLVRDKLQRCIELYRKETPLDEAMKEVKLVSGMESRLVTVAAKAGASDTIFAKLGEQYNEKTTAALGRMTTIIETVLVVILATLVGAVLLSVMLPLVSMISAIG